MIDILLKCILFLNDLDAQSDFDKKNVTKKPVKQNHSYLEYALVTAGFYPVLIAKALKNGSKSKLLLLMNVRLVIKGISFQRGFINSLGQ